MNSWKPFTPEDFYGDFSEEVGELLRRLRRCNHQGRGYSCEREALKWIEEGAILAECNEERPWTAFECIRRHARAALGIEEKG